MGLIQDVTEPLVAEFQKLGLASQIVVGFVSFIVLSVVLTVGKQIFFKDPHAPPMVFHLFPFIGSTVEYGMDPPKFFRKMQAKVFFSHSRVLTFLFGRRAISHSVSFLARRHLHLHPARQEDDGGPWHPRQRVHPERQAARRER
jgi:hypothetical protein